MNDNNISDIIRSSLENAKGMISSDTVIGEPIETSSGTTVIPLSKVSVGIASGGVDYDSKKDEGKNFGGGGGTGIVVTPVGFLIVKSDGSVEILNMDGPVDPVSRELSDIVCSLVKKAPELLCKLKKSFKGKEDGECAFDEEESEPEDISEEITLEKNI